MNDFQYLIKDSIRFKLQWKQFYQSNLNAISHFLIQDDVAEYCNRKYSQLATERRMAIELNNGRAAQMGILALMVHEKLDNNPYIIKSLLGAPVPFN